MISYSYSEITYSEPVMSYSYTYTIDEPEMVGGDWNSYSYSMVTSSYSYSTYTSEPTYSYSTVSTVGCDTTSFADSHGDGCDWYWNN